jgi:2,4-diketo-3-deoxy-L-fuconate hydrolase
VRVGNLAGRATLFVGNGAIDVETATNGRVGSDPTEAFSNLDRLRDLDTSSIVPVAYDTSSLLAPSPTPRQVVAIGLNYQAHADEMRLEIPKLPAAFTKFPSCLTGPRATVELCSDAVDWEAEVVVVIGDVTHRVAEDDVWRHVAGITVGQDLSDRRVQVHTGGQFALAKSFPGFGPTGPWMCTTDELSDPDDLHVRCTLNGEVVQDARSSEMILSIPEIVARLSAVITLWPGDLIFTGSPSGTGVSHDPPRFLTPGDELVTTVDQVGELQTAFVAGPDNLTNLE